MADIELDTNTNIVTIGQNEDAKSVPNGQSLHLAQGGSLHAQGPGGYGINAQGGTVLTIDGVVKSDTSWAVGFRSFVLNQSTNVTVGQFGALDGGIISSNALVVVNNGIIKANSQDAVWFGASINLTNSGTIQGTIHGHTASSGMITNNGMIVGDVDCSSSTQITIDTTNGTINGKVMLSATGASSFIGGGGNDDVTLGGNNDTISLGGGSDIVRTAELARTTSSEVATTR